MFGRASLVATAACAMAFATAALHPSTARAQLDSPRLSVVASDRSSVRLIISAGHSGTPTGFTVEWMRRGDHELLGGWPADPEHESLLRCEFTGVPTLTITPGVSDFALGANVSAIVEIGDLLDETGVHSHDRDELAWHTEYLFRAFARPSGDDPQSIASQTLPGITDPGGADCLFSQGFWKNHPDLWPASFMRLGNVTYTQRQLLDILDQPADGNGLVFLAHQLIAAKLNLGAGADPALIQLALDSADAMIGSLVVPPLGGGFIHPRDASALTEQLDAFNNGKVGIECNPVAVEAAAWSSIKNLYR